MAKKHEDFDDWWDRLTDLAINLGKDIYLRDKAYHITDWYAGLTPAEVIDYRVEEFMGAYTTNE